MPKRLNQSKCRSVCELGLASGTITFIVIVVVVFKCCWRESFNPLQFYFNALPISYFIDQRRLTFWLKIQNSNNIVLRTLSSLKHHSFVAIAAKYGISSHNVSYFRSERRFGRLSLLQYLLSANSVRISYFYFV